MKKLLKVSLVAMLVATPMVASAALPYAGVDSNNQAITDSNGTLGTVAANDHVATTSYVQGAYNVAAKGVNDVDTKVGSLSTLTASGTGAFDSNNAPTDLATAVNAAMQTAKDAASGSDSKIGTLSSLDGSFNADQKATVTAAINAVDGRVDTLEGQMGNISLSNVTGLTNTNVTGAIVELQNDKLETSKATVATLQDGSYNVIAAGDNVNTNLVNLDTQVGKLSADGNYTTAANSNASNIQALDTQVKSNTDAIGNTSYTGGTLSAAVAALQTAQSTAGTNVGDLSSLTTDAKTSVVAAINEVDANTDTNTTAITNITNGTTNITYDPTASGLSATNVKTAIDELAGKKVPVYGTWGSDSRTAYADLATPQQ